MPDKCYRAVICREIDEPDLVDTVYRFRKDLFVDLHGWDLRTEGDRERDQFDTPQTMHCALFHADDLVGTFRALRTDGPYLGAEVFPALASVHPFPRQADRWEISRFGVMPRAGDVLTAKVAYAVMFHFARAVHARGLVAIADLTYERFLATLGVRSRRYGPPQVIGQSRAGRPIEVVAGEIPIAAQSGERFERLIALIDTVEITDAGQVFGSARISA